METGATGQHAWDVTYIGFLLGHGGDALQMLTLASGIQQLGLRVNVIVPELDTTLGFAQRCREVHVPCERSPLITSDLHGRRQNLGSLVRFFRSLDAGLLHLQTGNSCLPRAAMLALELLRKPRGVVTLQSPYETIDPSSMRARFWSTAATRRLHAVVSPSVHGTEFQVRCGVPPDMALTIHNAVDLELMSSGDGSVARGQLGLTDDVPLVLFCSRLDSQKRPVEAVRVFARIKSEFPQAVLVFVGDGEQRSAVEQEVSTLGLTGQVRLVGYQTNIPDWLAAATVWLLPTERENFSVALLEALAAGCPVVTTACPGNDEVIVDGKNALSFGVGDLDVAAEKLRCLLSDPALRHQLSAEARRSADQYSASKMVAQYHELYNRVALDRLT